MQQSSSSGPSDIVRRVRQGDTGLTIATDGRLRLDAYTQALDGLDWRDLGAVLAQLTAALDDSMAGTRCAMALAVTVLAMQGSGAEKMPVNESFVRSMFGKLVRACAAQQQQQLAAAVYPVVRCIARCLRTSPQELQAFAASAVLAGITAGPETPGAAKKKKKKRRLDTTIAALALVLTRALTAGLPATKCVTRILRANGGHVVERLGSLPDGPQTVRHLYVALVDRACAEDALDGETDELFACIRDIVPRIPPDKPNVSVVRLVDLLVQRIFRPLLQQGTGTSIYTECARLRIRCYQWAVLCRMATWLTESGDAAAAEASRLCFLQITASPSVEEKEGPAEAQAAWLLLLSESLAHIAGRYPRQKTSSPGKETHPLYVQAQEVQARVFAAIAALLAELPRQLDRFSEANPAALQLLHTCVALCEHLLTLVHPRAAVLGLELPQPATAPHDGIFDSRTTTVAEYVFGPRQRVAEATEVGHESEHEARIAGVFMGLDTAAQAIASGSSDSAHWTAATACLRTALMWLRMYTAAARDSVGRQTRTLESMPGSIHVWMNGARVVVQRPATDWARLQRIAVAGSGAFRDPVSRALKLLMALAVWPYLDAQTIIMQKEGLRESVDIVKTLATTNSVQEAREFRMLAFAALQTLASIAGVRIGVVTSRNASDLRPPHVHVRDRTPPSSEALVHLAMQLGAAQLLLHPRLVTGAVGLVDPMGPEPGARAFVALQLWLDIIGTVVRHSLFRSFLDPATFRRWWCLSLAASIRPTVPPHLDPRRLRMALTISMYLASWQRYLTTSGSESLRGFTQITARNDCVDDMQLVGCLKALEAEPLAPSIASQPGSIIPVVFFCACRMWLTAPVLSRDPSIDERPMVLRVCRDLWGIATEMLLLLTRILRHHPPALRALVAPRPGLVEDFANILATLTAGPQVPLFPCVVADIIASNVDSNSSNSSPPSSPSQDTIDQDYRITKSENADQSPDQTIDGQPPNQAIDDQDVVDRLLRQTADAMPRQLAAAALDSYYREPIQAVLWTNYTDQLARFPSILAFGGSASIDMNQWLDDADDVLPRLFMPLLAARHRVACHPRALWAAMDQAFSTHSINYTMQSVSSSSAFIRASVSAAYLLPPTAEGRACLLSGNLLETLVIQAGEGSRAALDALLFLAWRHRIELQQYTGLCARRLEETVGAALSRLAASLDTSTDHAQIVALSGANRSDLQSPVLVPLGFLLQSDVFRAMLTGPFREAVDRGSPSLQCDHATMTDLFAIVFILRSHHLGQTAHLLSQYSVYRLANILQLAVFYDIRLLVTVLLWFFIDQASRGLIPAATGDPDQQADEDEALWLLSVLFRDTPIVVAAFDGLPDPMDAVRALATLLLLCLDRAHVADVVATNTTVFVDTLRFAFSL